MNVNIDAFAVYDAAGYTNDNVINVSTFARSVCKYLVLVSLLLTVVNTTTLFCILRYFGKLRVPLIAEDTGFDSTQNGIFTIFYFEQAATKRRLRSDRKKTTERKKASQRPRFPLGKRMELFLHDNDNGD